MTSTVKITTLSKKEWIIDHAIPEGQRDWIEHFYMVAALPYRFVGLAEETPVPCKPFRLYAALHYLHEMTFQNMLKLDEKGQPIVVNGQPVVEGVRMMPKLHMLIPVDLMAPLDLDISAPWLTRVADMEGEMRTWFIEKYMDRLVGPPQVLAPKGPLIIPPK